MFGKGITLFKLFGFRVRIDASWLIIALLITWSLATGVFPNEFSGYSSGMYWLMGLVGALGLFLSIIIHEMSHSLVARRFGLPIEGITLFIFGGVAHMDEEPANPQTEFWMAIAGPIASIVLAALFFALHAVAVLQEWNAPLSGVVNYLGIINLILAIFNLVPAFPLDGGRVLRAALWKWKNIHDATRIASRIGALFGAFLIALGIFQFLTGRLVGGIWWVLIGFFLRAASIGSYRQRVVQETLSNDHVEELMDKDPVVVESNLALNDFMHNYVYKHHEMFYPVQTDEKLAGCIMVQDLKGIPQEEWPKHHINEYMRKCENETTIQRDEDAASALALMSRTKNDRLLVLDGEKLAGILTLKTLNNVLNLKLDFDSNVTHKASA